MFPVEFRIWHSLCEFVARWVANVKSTPLAPIRIGRRKVRPQFPAQSSNYSKACHPRIAILVDRSCPAEGRFFVPPCLFSLPDPKTPHALRRCGGIVDFHRCRPATKPLRSEATARSIEPFFRDATPLRSCTAVDRSPRPRGRCWSKPNARNSRSRWTLVPCCPTLHCSKEATWLPWHFRARATN
jgi:hypothetical protein